MSLQKDTPPEPTSINLRSIQVGFPKLRQIIKFLPIYIRSSIIGTGVGMLPGAGGSIASFMAYNETKRVSKTPEKFGTGISEGVAAGRVRQQRHGLGRHDPHAHPGRAGRLGGRHHDGRAHGPRPAAREPTCSLTTATSSTPSFLSLYLANVFMLLYGMYLAPYFTLATRTPLHYLAISVILLTVMGSYALRASMFDVYVMLTFGILGYLMKSYGFSVVPTVLGIILGPVAESGLNNMMAIAEGQNLMMYLIRRPISVVLLILILISTALPIYRRIKDSRRTSGSV